jgi:hypothetical protein
MGIGEGSRTMSRRRPPNRTVCETFKIKPREDAGASFYVSVDRESPDGFAVGRVVGVRIQYKHARGSDLDAALLKISDLISREVQTVEKVLAE